MKTDFQYMRDNRTTAQYKQYFEVGIYNQKVAMNQLVKDMAKIGWDLKIEWTDHNDTFTTHSETIDSYNPDATILFYKNGELKNKYVVEIKVSDKEVGEFIHIKSYQLRKLFEKNPDSKIFYSTPTRYVAISVKFILEKCQKVLQSEKIGGKECHEIWTPGITWKFYSERLEIKEYPRQTKIC